MPPAPAHHYALLPWRCTRPTGPTWIPPRCSQRCPSSPVAGTGWLPGWRLTFGGEDLGWDGALATVVEDPESSVFVVLYDMADSDERTLDSWEGADLGLYTKIRLRVHTLEGDVLAWLYALQAFEGGLPSARYLGRDRRRRGGRRRAGRVRQRHPQPAAAGKLIREARPAPVRPRVLTNRYHRVTLRDAVS